MGMSSETLKNWQDAVKEFQQSDRGRSIWQLTNSIGPYILLWVIMVLTIHISFWLTLGLSIITAAFLVRTFIIFHDCGHGSFFESRKANDFWGVVTGILTLTPYYQWRHDHAVHHATAGDLDRRGVGDVWTMTVKEYQAATPIKKFVYRFYRHPLVMFFLGPIFSFGLTNRLPHKDATRKARLNVHFTNVVLLAIAVGMHFIIGIKAYLLIQLSIVLFGGMAGIWLFYVQHQFEGTYWAEHEDWDYLSAALKGSSYYKLPRVLQWFSGNIGLHHIHHLSPRIPNYKLQPCLDANPMFQIEPVTLLSSFKSLGFRLWDEQANKLVGFRYARLMSEQS